MIKLKLKKEVRFSIVVIIFGLALFISTIFFPWISFSDMANGGAEFHLNYDMMAQSSFPNISHIAGRINSINCLLFLTVILGLFSLLGVSYHVASKVSKVGYYLMISSNVMIIIVSILLVIHYFSIIFYINDVAMISLSSPFPYFSYSFISLIGSVVFLIISGLYGGYITFLILLQYKEIRHEMKKFSGFQIFNHNPHAKELEMEKCRRENITGIYSVTKNNDELAAFSADNTKDIEVDNSKEFEDNSEEFIIEESDDEDIEEEIDEEGMQSKSEKDEGARVPFSFDKPVEKSKKAFDESKEKNIIFDKNRERAPSPFSFDKKNKKINKNEEDINLSGLKPNLQNKKSLEIIEQGRREAQRDIQKESTVKSQPTIDPSLRIDGIFQLNDQINNDIDKRSISVMCPKCRHIFSVTKTGDVSTIKCPVCGKEGTIK